MFSQARAQVPLSAYMDANGYADVQALKCPQLANTFQKDADYLAALYSDWYNGLGKQHPEMKVIQAIDAIFKTQAR